MPSSLIDLFVETKEDEDKANEDVEPNTEEALEIDYDDALLEEEENFWKCYCFHGIFTMNNEWPGFISQSLLLKLTI